MRTGTTTLAVNVGGHQGLAGRATLIVDATQGPVESRWFLGLRPRLGLSDLIDHMGWIDPGSPPSSRIRLRASRDGGVRVHSAVRLAVRGGDSGLRCLSATYDFVAAMPSQLRHPPFAGWPCPWCCWSQSDDLPAETCSGHRFAAVSASPRRIASSESHFRHGVCSCPRSSSRGRSIDFQVMSATARSAAR